MGHNRGSGPGTITPDGCAVEVYARLPAAGDPELIDDHTSAEASILDLGAGTGRIADPLERLGHHVVAVDDSVDMLARIQLATTVHSHIEVLELVERFDAAILASNLMNNPDASLRRSFLRAATRHLTATGVLFVQWHPPEWFDGLVPGPSHTIRAGDVTITRTVDAWEADLLTSTVNYDFEDQRWTHHWRQRRLRVDDLQHDMRQSGLRLQRFLTPDRTWLLAERAGSHTASTVEPV